ncbi:MAG: Zn-ribbon domain-containing OB-fold protein [Solirubrobacteraceae bacterium]
MAATHPPAKPAPIPDEASAPFFAGAAEGKLMLLRCRACGTFQSPTAPYLGQPVRPRCLECFAADLDWAPAGGRATLYSFALVHQRYDEAFAADLPYNIAVVETEEGVRLTTQIVDCPGEELRIGMALEVTFEQRGDAVWIPTFRPRG